MTKKRLPTVNELVPDDAPDQDEDNARLTAIFDEAAHTLTCPYCGTTLPLTAWTLIEVGYERYWSFELDDTDALSAADDAFSDDGNGHYFVVHDRHASPGDHQSPACGDRARAPEGLEWEWNARV